MAVILIRTQLLLKTSVSLTKMRIIRASESIDPRLSPMPDAQSRMVSHPSGVVTRVSDEYLEDLGEGIHEVPCDRN